MKHQSPHRILFFSTAPTARDAVSTALTDAGYTVEYFAGECNASLGGDLQQVDLLVVEGALPGVLERCRNLRVELDDRYVPIVALTDTGVPTLGEAAYEAGADAWVGRPVATPSFLATVRSLMRIKEREDRLRQEANKLRREVRRIQFMVRNMDEELRFANQIQCSLLPQTLPSIPPVRFAVKFEIAGSVSGDFYDVMRLDERMLGFYVLDAMGHGVPAGLLTIYVKKGITTKDVDDDGHRILTPDEVLTRLNRDLLEQELSENPFITMAYFTLNLDELSLQFARAGHPYPLRVPKEGAIEPLSAEGTLLGVFENEYSLTNVQLCPGDRLLVYTDGIDSVRYGSNRQGFDSFRACVEDLRDRPIEEYIEGVYESLFPHRQHEDDFTLLGVEIGES